MTKYAAVIRKAGAALFEEDAQYNTIMQGHKIVLVPEGQPLSMDESASRKWLHPYLKSGWYLQAFVEIEEPK